jgi:hypothetical protein
MTEGLLASQEELCFMELLQACRSYVFGMQVVGRIFLNTEAVITEV